MKYTNTQIELVLEKLKNMPPVKEKNQGCSKQEAVKLLKKEISSMQQRGYALDQISEVLRTEGIDITTPTLKSYLQRAKTNNTKNLVKKSKVVFTDSEIEPINIKSSVTAKASYINEI